MSLQGYLNTDSIHSNRLEKLQRTPFYSKAVEHLEEFFHYPLLLFRDVSTPLHSKSSFEVTFRLDRERPDSFKVWAAFLEGLDKAKVASPNGEPLEMDMGIQLERLHGKPITVEVESLYSYWKKPSRQDLEAIEKLQTLCFGKSERFSLQGGKGLVARRKETKEILGFIWYYEKDGCVRISGLGRHPGATHLRIGGQLIHQMLLELKPTQPVSVIMRQSNPAAHLFSKWGFEKEKDLPKYFLQGPAENGILLKLDWKKFQKAIAL